MARMLTARLAAALRKRSPLALLAEIEHPDGTARFWTGVGMLEWNGYSWAGSGALGRVTPIKQTTTLAIQEIVFSLAAVDPAIVATLSDDVRNRSGKVWLACIGSGNSVIDPFQIVDSELDYQSFSADADGKVGIAITARSGFYTLVRALDESWTSEEQYLVYPTDSGLDLISSLQNQELQWTRT